MFTLSLVSGFGLLFLPESFTPFALFVTILGVTGGLNLVWQGTIELFPSLYVGSVFGAVSFIAHILGIFAPMVAEIDQPIPMIIYVVILGTSTGASFFITPKSEYRTFN